MRASRHLSGMGGVVSVVTVLAVVFTAAHVYAEVEDTLKYWTRPPVQKEAQGNPKESPQADPQATSRPMDLCDPDRKPDQTIPERIMVQFDKDVVDGKRPTYASLTQDCIYRLREQPRFNADFVRLDIDLDKLSNSQMGILREWAVGGYNRVMLMGQEIGRYAELFGGRAALFRSDNDSTARALEMIHPHPVTTDCALVTVPFDWREYELSRSYVWEGMTAGWTPRTTVFAYYRDAKNMRPRGPAKYGDRKQHEVDRKQDRVYEQVAAYGYFMAGKTQVFFRPFYLATGGDGCRLELNWAHWILGRPVPAIMHTDVIDRPDDRIPATKPTTKPASRG